jgi:hypothetical protein
MMWTIPDPAFIDQYSGLNGTENYPAPVYSTGENVNNLLGNDCSSSSHVLVK